MLNSSEAISSLLEESVLRSQSHERARKNNQQSLLMVLQVGAGEQK